MLLLSGIFRKLRSGLVAKVGLATLLLTFFYMMTYIFTAEGETTLPKFVLLRLEDVGPGGQYSSFEQLGKLRAVIDFLRERGVPIHVAVIPRWINVDSDGERYDKSLGDLSDPYIAAFDKVLRDAERGGASIGMHGYTHQIGSVKRQDGFQESAIGNEFHVNGLEETDRVAFAEARMEEGLSVLHGAGLTPRFWEAPHYHTTAEQDAVFRRYFGLLYQADVHANRNASEAQYVTDRTAIQDLGAVYVPTPFSYIPYNKDENIILDKLGKSKNIASFFYHPFLEFKYLLPVTDSEGKPLLKDGLPMYRYPVKDKTLLQKLTTKLREKGYAFYSIHDYVPFTPAASWMTADSPDSVMVQIGDVNGDRQADLVQWEMNNGNFIVTPGHFVEQRGVASEAPQVWATVPYTPGSVFALQESNRNGRLDLWVFHADNKMLELYEAGNDRFTLRQSWSVPIGRLQELFILPLKNGNMLACGPSADHLSLMGTILHDGKADVLKPFKFKTDLPKRFMVTIDAAGLAKPGSPALVLAKKDESILSVFVPDPTTLEWKMQKTELPMPRERGELYLGDFNGDGREDVLRYDTESQTYQVYLQTESGEYRLLSVFGPWGRIGGKLIVTDLDGNGKSDLALIEHSEMFVDTALSYESVERHESKRN